MLLGSVNFQLLELRGAIGDSCALQFDLLLLFESNVILCLLDSLRELLELALFLVKLGSLVLDDLLEAFHIAYLMPIDLHDVLVLEVQLGQLLVQLLEVLLMAAVHRVDVVLVGALNILHFTFDRMRHLDLHDADHLLHPDLLDLRVLHDVSFPSFVFTFESCDILVNLHQDLLLSLLHQAHQVVLLADHVVESPQLLLEVILAIL